MPPAPVWKLADMLLGKNMSRRGRSRAPATGGWRLAPVHMQGSDKPGIYIDALLKIFRSLLASCAHLVCSHSTSDALSYGWLVCFYQHDWLQGFQHASAVASEPIVFTCCCSIESEQQHNHANWLHGGRDSNRLDLQCMFTKPRDGRLRAALIRKIARSSRTGSRSYLCAMWLCNRLAMFIVAM